MTKNEFFQAKEFISDERVLFFAERVMVAQQGLPVSWGYDRQSHVGTLNNGLDEAKARGWTVVSMKDDGKTIFPK